MATTMLDLIHRAEFGLTVVAASRESLTIPLTRACVTDLVNPGRFITPGTLVASSGLWARSPENIDRFVDALAESRAAALVIGLVEIGIIPDRVIARCRERGLPLLAVGDDVDFTGIVSSVNHDSDESSNLLERGIDFTRRVLDSPDGDLTTADVLTRFTAEFGIECWLSSGTGLATVWSGIEPSAEEIADVWNRVMRDGANEATIVTVTGETVSVFALGGRSDPTSGFLVCRSSAEGWDPGLSIVVRSMLGVLRVEVVRTELAQAATRQRQSQFIEVLTDEQSSPAELSARFRLEGSDPTLPTAAVAAEVADDFPTEGLLQLLMGAVADLDPIGGMLEGGVILLLNSVAEIGDPLLDRFRAAVSEHALLLDGRQVRLGISEPVSDVVELGDAVSMARERMLGVTGRDDLLIGYDSRAHTHQSLLATLGERARGAFAEALLGPVLAYDERHSSDLLGTLSVFLDRNGSWQSAADELHIHPNTLRYRIGRVSELTKRDLGSMQDRVDLHLAIACHDGGRLRNRPAVVAAKAPQLSSR